MVQLTLQEYISPNIRRAEQVVLWLESHEIGGARK